ncbi:MAG: hypothetical protein J2O46_01245 [Nocardioides sp.]|nr:hypothetical protein [Nocardioides sp.]
MTSTPSGTSNPPSSTPAMRSPSTSTVVSVARNRVPSKARLARIAYMQPTVVRSGRVRHAQFWGCGEVPVAIDAKTAKCAGSRFQRAETGEEQPM